MGSEIIVVPVIFATVFGIIYLFFATRNKERLALIEKGADASIFVKGSYISPVWKVFILNFALALIGTGIGVFIGSLLDQYTSLGDPAYPGSIFLMAGIGLFIGFYMTKNLDKTQ